MLDYVLTDGGKFFSNKYGIIKSLYERRSGIANSNSRDIVSIININNTKSINGGGNQSLQSASIASIGEAIERYCLKSYDPDILIKATYIELDYNKPTINQLNFFLKEQYVHYPLLPQFFAHNKINWVIGKSFINNTLIAIPASLTYLPYYFEPNEPALSAQLSPGTACHYDYNQGILLALLECVERDAFTLFWEAGIRFPLIHDHLIHEYLESRKIQPKQVQIHCLDITTDINIPVVLTLILNKRPPFVSIGIAAALEPVQALEKSISEAITSWQSSYEIALNNSFDSDLVMAGLKKEPDFLMHAIYHCFVDTRPYLLKLLSNCPTSTRFKNLSLSYKDKLTNSEALQQVRVIFANLGYDVIIIDITSRDIKDHGLHVIRAVSYDLVRPTLGLIYRHLNNARFLEIPKKLGLSSQRNTMQEILNFQMPTL